MKRRAISFITVLALCLSLCPVQAMAAGRETDVGLCPHHQVHTAECGYVPPAAGQDCAHEHDENCLAEDGSCGHWHDGACGYAAEDAGAPCTFVCQVCSDGELAGELLPSAALDDESHVENQVEASPGLYTALPGGEQEGLDLPRGLAPEARPDAANAPMPIAVDLPSTKYTYKTAATRAGSFSVEKPTTFVFQEGGSYTSTDAATVIVKNKGELYLTTDSAGKIDSKVDSGIQVWSGGFLCVLDAGITVSGEICGLDILLGGTAQLFGGKFTGKTAAIRLTDGDYSALLAPGCAYFDEGGNPVPLTDVGNKKTVEVKEHTKHTYAYAPNSGVPTHDGVCIYCGAAAATEKCTFSFAENGDGAGTCDGCGRTLKIDINENSLGSLVYDGTEKPADVDNLIDKVELDSGSGGSTILTKTEDYNNCYDYTVDCTPRSSVGAGNFTVTVTGDTYEGKFTKTFTINKATPEIAWNSPAPVEVTVPYDGSPVEEGDLPEVIIEVPVTVPGVKAADLEELNGLLLFSHRKTGDNSFTDGLPANAGVYEVKAGLPATQNYEAVETTCLTLTINKIPALIKPPEAATPSYTGKALELVTPGEVEAGAVILYATSKDGDYSESIPTGIDAGDYEVWYKIVDNTNNYESAEGTEVTGVKIMRRKITPVIELEYDTCVYDGGFKKPKVTVRDPENREEALPDTEYDVTYEANQNAGTAKVIVTDKEKGNYEILANDGATFEITPMDQTALEITSRPNSVSYGDVFTLGTTGGLGSGAVTWKIIGAKDADGNAVTVEADIRKIAEIGANSGQVTVTGLGTVTVQATKSGTASAAGTAGNTGSVTGNYKDATAVWEFTIGPKRVTATVTAESKTYDGKGEAEVTAWVEPGDLVSTADKVGITGLEGTFSDANAGTTKTVTVDMSKVRIGEDGKQPGEAGNKKYIVTIPSTPLRADIMPKTVAAADITLDTGYNYVYDGAAKEPGVTVKDGDDVIPASEYDVVYTNNINAGTGTAAVRIVDRAGGNYVVSGSKTFDILKATARFIVDPVGATGLVYKGRPQPLLSVAGVPEGGTVVYTLNGTKSGEVPAGTERGAYKGSVHVEGDANHTSSAPKEFDVTIGVNEMKSPTIALSAYSFRYDGNEHRPAVTIQDDGGDVIASNEYTLAYDNNVNAGTGTVTIKLNGNYSFSEELSSSEGLSFPSEDRSTAVASFTILSADQTPLEITGKPSGTVRYGDTLHLGTTGGSGTGGVTWSIEAGNEDGNNKAIEQVGNGGEFNIIGVGTITIKATKISGTGSNYEASEAKWTFYADRKQVTAVLTGQNKPYDGGKTATVSAKIADIDLVSHNSVRDTITIPPLTGEFETADVGTNIKITKIAPPDPANVTGAAKYEIFYPDTAAADITQRQITPIIELTPSSSTYNGSEQKPDVKVTYDADEDHKGVEVLSKEYTVAYRNNVSAGIDTAVVTVTAKAGGNYRFDAAEKKFTINKAAQDSLSITDMPATVCYGDSFSLHTAGGSGTGAVTWSITTDPGTDPDDVAEITDDGTVTVTGVGKFTVTAQKAGDGNYNASNAASKEFTADPRPITPDVKAADKPFDGGTAAVVTASWKDGDLVGDDIIDIKVVKSEFRSAAVGEDTVEVELEFKGDKISNYKITYPKTVPASITAAPLSLEGIAVAAREGLTYDPRPGSTSQELVERKDETEINGVLVYSVNEGEYKPDIPVGTNAGTYTVSYKVRAAGGDEDHTDSKVETVTVTIGKARPEIVTQPQPESATIQTGVNTSTVKLINGKAAYMGVDVEGDFICDSATFKKPGSFSVSAKFYPKDKVNYVSPVGISGTIDFTAVGEDLSGPGGPDMEISMEPEPDTPRIPVSSTNTSASTNRNTSKQPDTENTSVQASVRNGTASAVLNTAAGDKLVDEAVAAQSAAVVIRPEITGDVTRTEVSIPASAVSRIKNETDAALTVATPIAEVTIPNAALDALSASGDTVSIVAEQVDNTVVLTLSGDGKDVGTIPGGLTLTVPAEGAGPGTVAVLIHEDGTRETIRWSVAEDGTVRIPLNGSATVEIVDNSKEFADVPAESWAADAVAFASAHELFNGTGEATFSPEQSMSRAMLATVLYNLEGCPEQSLTGGFSDVSDGAWYASSVSWAAANGVTGGYGDGQFGPNDSITREQFAVMLWRYVGNPTAGEQALDFTDADQVSGYAVEALNWAAASGVLGGYGDGRLDPNGLATRAQAAQMLKNFMENT